MKYWMSLAALCLLMIFSINTISYAQPDVTIEDVDEAMGTDDYEKKGFRTDRLFTGGTVGLGFGSVSANVEVSPQLGYRITDHFHFGLNMSYIFQSVKINGGGSINNSAFGGGPFLRYLLFNFEGLSNNYGKESGLPMSGIYAAAEFQRVKGRTNQEFNPGERVLLEGENALMFGLGYTSNYYRGFGYYFEIMYNVIWEETFLNERNPNLGTLTQSSFWPWAWMPRAGIFYGF
ncbi:MAG: hypothetical protein AAF502_07710 [Bacteroidota bacterium]